METIAIALLHSYRNPSHEREIREYLSKRYSPVQTWSLSSDIAPEVREYPRTSTTVANAYVDPPLRKHLSEMDIRVEGHLGFDGIIYLMLSEGGITTLDAARSFSGPTHRVRTGRAGRDRPRPTTERHSDTQTCCRSTWEAPLRSCA